LLTTEKVFGSEQILGCRGLLRHAEATRKKGAQRRTHDNSRGSIFSCAPDSWCYGVHSEV